MPDGNNFDLHYAIVHPNFRRPHGAGGAKPMKVCGDSLIAA